MILETAILDVRDGQAANFEKAFAEARPLVVQTAGFQRLELRRCLETSNRYLLMIWWDSVESHTIGFRQSLRYEEWKRLLHHFYDPFPVVEHYELIAGDAV
jgi:heme-degrading monooxygenase HmoA